MKLCIVFELYCTQCHVLACDSIPIVSILMMSAVPAPATQQSREKIIDEEVEEEEGENGGKMKKDMEKLCFRFPIIIVLILVSNISISDTCLDILYEMYVCTHINGFNFNFNFA